MTSTFLHLSPQDTKCPKTTRQAFRSSSEVVWHSTFSKKWRKEFFWRKVYPSKNWDLFSWWFFLMDSTMVNHHQTTMWDNIFLLPSILENYRPIFFPHPKGRTWSSLHHMPSFFHVRGKLVFDFGEYTLPKTNSLHLKIDGAWKTVYLSFWGPRPIFRVHHKHQPLHDKINPKNCQVLSLGFPWWFRVSPIF